MRISKTDLINRLTALEQALLQADYHNSRHVFGCYGLDDSFNRLRWVAQSLSQQLFPDESQRRARLYDLGLLALIRQYLNQTELTDFTPALLNRLASFEYEQKKASLVANSPKLSWQDLQSNTNNHHQPANTRSHDHDLVSDV